jgi:hypothetical protein
MSTKENKLTYYTFEGPLYLTDGSKLSNKNFFQTLHMSINEGDKYNNVHPKVEFNWDISLEKTENTEGIGNGPRYQLFDSCTFSINLEKENDYYFISELLFNGNIGNMELPMFEIFYMLGKQHIGITDERMKKEINQHNIDRFDENKLVDESAGSWYE